MATLRKITLNWEIRTGAITCDTGYIKRQEKCDVDLYVTVDGTAYALDTGWALNLTFKPHLLTDNSALVQVTSWTASATTGLYQSTAQVMGSVALDAYLAANNADTTDDEGNKLVDLDVYYTVSAAMQSKSDTVTMFCKPDVASADDGTPVEVAAPDAEWVAHGHAQTLTAGQKLQASTNLGLNLTASKLLGQASSGGTGLPVPITLGTGLTMTGTTLDASGGTSIATTNTLWVDKSGSDANAGTLAAPYLTPDAAESAASAGTTVQVAPGSYSLSATIGKTGVAYHFQPGATVSRISVDNNGAIDDDNAAKTFQISGDGVLSLDYRGSAYAACVNVLHSSSVVSIDCESIVAVSGAGNSAGSIGVQTYGATTIRASKSITSTDSLLASGIGVIWWSRALSISSPYIMGSDCAISAACPAAPLGDMFIEADLIESTAVVPQNGYAVIQEISASTSAASWIRSKIIKSPSVAVTAVDLQGNGKMYVTSQKIFGRVATASFGGTGLLYVDTDKIDALGNGTSGTPSLIHATAGVLRMACRHWNVGTHTGQTIKVTGGTAYLDGGDFTGNSGSNGIEVTGGTVYLSGLIVDTSANSSTDALTVSGGTVYLINCKLKSHASRVDIAQSGGTVTVTGGSGSGTNGAFDTSGTVGFAHPQFSSSITTPDTSFDLLNTTATTVNAFGDATQVNIGAANGALNIGSGSTYNFDGSALNIAAGVLQEAANKCLEWVASSTPVNWLKVTSSDTTAPVLISADGSDTDIGITLTPKGAGVVTVPGLTAGAINADSLTSGGAIVTTGSLAHIATQESDAYIQTRSTFKLTDGANVTTIAHGPSGNNTVTLPDGSTTLGGLAMTQTWSGTNTFSTKPVTLSGNQSRTAWTTTGTGLVQSAATYTDTSSTGTVAVQAVNNLAQPTLVASSATTFTDSFHTRLAGPPVASTNVTQTRAHTLGILDSTSASSAITGALVVASTFGTSASSVGIGAGNVYAGGIIEATGAFRCNGTDGIYVFSTNLAALSQSATGLGLASAYRVSWSSGVDGRSSHVATISKNADGVLQIGTTGNNALGSLLLTNLTASGKIVTATQTPASASATGTTGTIAWDADYIYVCTATNTWKRVAIATW